MIGLWLSPQAALALAIALGALLLLVDGRLAPDLVALMVLAALGVAGLVDLTTLFSGFGNPVVLTIIAMFIVVGALEATGVTARLSRVVLRMAEGAPDSVLVGLLALAAGVISLVINTFASVALAAPIGRQVAHRRNTSPSRVLMPISFGALLGGMATLLTTSNLLLAHMLTERGLPSFGLLSFLPVGGPIALGGLIYVAVAAPRILPDHVPSDQWAALQQARSELTKTYDLDPRLFEAYVRSSSPLVNKTLAESDLGRQYGATVAAIVRGKKAIAPPLPSTRLQAGDCLVVGCRPDDAAAAGETLQMDITEHNLSRNGSLYANDAELAEVALSPHSPAIGQTLADIRFREQFGVNVLAIWREGRPWRSHLTDYRLNPGDGLLVQGSPWQLSALNREPGFLVLTRLPDIPETSGRAVIAIVILISFLIVVGLNLISVSVAALLAAIAAITTKCISIERARSDIRWQVIFVIGGMLPLASALESTGALGILSQGIPLVVQLWGDRAALLVIFLITTLLTQLITSTAATLIVGPLAIAAALQSHLNPQAMAMAVAIGASTAFLSPTAHPANLLVMSVGGYRFQDYPRLGIALVALTAVGVVVVIPLVYH